MTKEAIAAIVAKVKYRSWRFRIDDSGDIRVCAPVTCAYTKSKRKRRTVYGYVTGPEHCHNEDELLREIRDSISGILHHELGEWFTYKGKRYFESYTGH